MSRLEGTQGATCSMLIACIQARRLKDCCAMTRSDESYAQVKLHWVQ